MPIPVVCPGCKARFNVSDQFAGKKGPCPKCKVVITIPNAPPPAIKEEEVKIHVPEQYASAGKGTKGQAISKPIVRQEVKLSTNQIAMMVGAVLLVLLLAVMGRFMKGSMQMILIVVGLAAISGPIALAGYSFLRNDELEPYRGRSVLLRAGICAVVYAGLWGVFYALTSTGYVTGQMWEWLYVAPLFVVIGAATAFAVFDLDFGTASLHYAFFVVCTLLLRWAMGMPPIWSAATGK